MHKQFINDPATCVDDFFQGLLYAHKGLIQLPGLRVILRRDLENIAGKVAILSGGGAGHEPAHAGYVGRGMLTGAISGNVFTSPPPSSIFAAIKAVNKFRPSGLVLIVTNYTGDRLNFGLAREWAIAQGIKVEMVVVGEDCALHSVDRSAGRRGLAGTILAHKIGGALADRGSSMEEVVSFLTKVANNLGTISICLKPCVLPWGNASSFSLGEDEMELGLGIHGEAGIKRMKAMPCASTVEVMLEHMLNEKSSTHLPLNDKENVVVLVNNLGGTSNLEMGVVVKDTVRALEKRNLVIKRIFSGTFMTSLQMEGMSLTILRLSPFEKSDEQKLLLELLDAPAEVAFPLTSARFGANSTIPAFEDPSSEAAVEFTMKGPLLNRKDSSHLKECLLASCHALIEKEDLLNEYDRGAGDGDCGTTHTRGARKGLLLAESGDFSSPAAIFHEISKICSEEMGGSSGAIYSILFVSMAKKIGSEKEFNLKTLAGALQEGTETIKHYGGATRGDRTLIDVLDPLWISLLQAKDHDRTKTLEETLKVLDEAAKDTTNMKAGAGRASYVSQNQLKFPDAGATAVAAAVKAAIQVLLK